LRAEGLRLHNPAAATPRQREPQRPPRALADDKIVRPLPQPDRTTFAGLRDDVLLLLLLDTGIPLTECLAIALDDLDLEHRYIRLRPECVRGAYARRPRRRRLRRGRLCLSDPFTANSSAARSFLMLLPARCG